MTEEMTYSTLFIQHHRRIPVMPVLKVVQARLYQLLSTGIFHESQSSFLFPSTSSLSEENGDLKIVCLLKSPEQHN